MKRILVIGVQGQTGREVASLLVARDGVSVLGTSRDPGNSQLAGVTPIRFDWQDPTTWSAAIDGRPDAAYIARPEIEDAPERIAAFLAAAPDLQRVVLLSEIGGDQLPAEDWVARVEQAVSASAREATILRPASFCQLLTDARYLLEGIRANSEIEMPSEGSAVSFVDARDIAAVAVEALLGDGHAGRGYTLTGPQPVTFAAVASLLSDASQRPIRYVDAPLAETIEAWAGAGLEPFLLDYLRGALGRVCAGVYAQVSDDVERVTGSAPRSLEAFVDEHAAIWRTVAADEAAPVATA